jgi:hypothetical protein
MMVTNTHALDVTQVRLLQAMRPVLCSGCGSGSLTANLGFCLFASPCHDSSRCQRSCELWVTCKSQVSRFAAGTQLHAPTTHVVICAAQVAVGARHAALLTRGGEVYTWGSGQGGQLGNGTSGGTGFPYQVGMDAGPVPEARA